MLSQEVHQDFRLLRVLRTHFVLAHFVLALLVIFNCATPTLCSWNGCPPADPLPVCKRSTTWPILHIYHHIHIYIYIYIYINIQYIHCSSWKIKILIWALVQCILAKAVVGAFVGNGPFKHILKSRALHSSHWDSLASGGSLASAVCWVKLPLHDCRSIPLVAPMCFQVFSWF